MKAQAKSVWSRGKSSGFSNMRMSFLVLGSIPDAANSFLFFVVIIIFYYYFSLPISYLM